MAKLFYLFIVLLMALIMYIEKSMTFEAVCCEKYRQFYVYPGEAENILAILPKTEE